MSETILIVDDDRAIAQLVAIRISAAGYRALTASDSKTGLEAAKLHRPNLIVLDIRMPEMDGFEFHRRLKEIPEVSQTPVIFLSANSQEAARRKAMMSGALYYLTKPYEPQDLIGAVRGPPGAVHPNPMMLVGEREAAALAPTRPKSRERTHTMKMRTTKVLIADDDDAMRGLLARVLEGLDIDVIEARDAMGALVMAHAEPPDLAILDIGMPGGNGLSACEMLASEPALAHVPVIILTGKSDDATLFRCQRAGARYIRKGADAIDDVKAAVRRLLCVGEEASAARPELFVG